MSGFWQETPGLSPQRVKRHFRLIQLGLLNEFRNPNLRRPALAGALLAGAAAWLLRDTPGYALLTLTDWLGRCYGFVAAVWMTAYAARDLEGGTRAGLLFRAKPADGGAGMLINWAAGLGLWLALLVTGFVLPLFVLAATAGFATVPVVLNAFGYSVLAVLTLSTLAFAATRAFRHRVAGGLTVLAWFALEQSLTRLHLSPGYFPNALAWSFLALAVLTGVALILERRSRDEPVRPGVTAVILALLCIPVAGRAAAMFQGRSSTGALQSLDDRLALQAMSFGGRIPAVAVPDAQGKTIRTSDHAGKILLVFLFSTRDPHSDRTLHALRALHRELGPEGVQPLAVAIDTDADAGLLASRAASYGFPIGVDASMAGSSALVDSTVARTFGARTLPLLIVTDRRRTVQEIHYDRRWDLQPLRDIARARLAAEPR